MQVVSAFTFYSRGSTLRVCAGRLCFRLGKEVVSPVFIFYSGGPLFSFLFPQEVVPHASALPTPLVRANWLHTTQCWMPTYYISRYIYGVFSEMKLTYGIF